jgi:proteasome alpha subunit
MTMPFYVAPEQAMKDKADFARKGIARGRSAVVLTFADGVLLCAENPSTTLRKLAEIYDRIAFAGVGKFNEFDQLRIAGVRHADLKGYSFSREDVDARSLANQYAQILGQIFTHEMKPMEVEIVVAEIGEEPSRDQLYHIRYDGTVIDETRFLVIGGDSESIAARLGASYQPGASLDDALRIAVDALGGPERTIPPDELEVALLSRANGRRAFRRLDDEQVAAALASRPPRQGAPQAGAGGAGGTAGEKSRDASSEGGGSAPPG